MAASEPDVSELAEQLFASVRTIVLASRRMGFSGELSPAESAALANLKRAGVSTSAGLARVAQITPQAMGVTIAALEARGLVERASDPDDGRRILLSVSDAGKAMLSTRSSSAIAAMAQALEARYTDAERAALAAAAPLLQRLADGL